jgi:hypothetical protein
MLEINGLEFDEENEAKFAEHGLVAQQIDQILDSVFIVAQNRRGRRGIYLLIGRDHGGSCIAVPVEATNALGIWRPVTAWRCKPAKDTSWRGVLSMTEQQRDPRQLEHEDEWDLENAARMPPVRGRRTIVSVAFPPSDFQIIANVSASLQVPVSQFIREAAVEKAQAQTTIKSLTWTAGNLAYSRTDFASPGTISPAQGVKSSYRQQPGALSLETAANTA